MVPTPLPLRYVRETTVFFVLFYIYRLLLIVNNKTKDNKKSNSKRATTKLVDLTFHELKVNWSLTGLRYCMVS